MGYRGRFVFVNKPPFNLLIDKKGLTAAEYERRVEDFKIENIAVSTLDGIYTYTGINPNTYDSKILRTEKGEFVNCDMINSEELMRCESVDRLKNIVLHDCINTSRIDEGDVVMYSRFCIPRFVSTRDVALTILNRIQDYLDDYDRGEDAFKINSPTDLQDYLVSQHLKGMVSPEFYNNVESDKINNHSVRISAFSSVQTDNIGSVIQLERSGLFNRLVANERLESIYVDNPELEPTISLLNFDKNLILMEGISLELNRIIDSKKVVDGIHIIVELDGNNFHFIGINVDSRLISKVLMKRIAHSNMATEF